jgi:hypothetical protein
MIDAPLLSEVAPDTDFVDHSQLRVTWINKSCLCCKIAYFPDARLTFCGHWRVRLKVPILASIFFILIFASFVYDLLTASFLTFFLKCLIFSIISFFALSLISSYFLIICRGPGYAPYNWSLIHQNHPNWQTAMSSMVIFKEQADFARSSERPPRASFSLEARRFVLRADHYCVWTESWIGIRNHRFFMLMTIYATLYAISYCVFRVFWTVNIVRGSEKFSATWVIGGLATLMIVVPGGLGVFHFFIAFRNLIARQTSVERYHKRTVNKRDSYWAEFEDICGPRWLCLCWVFPCCACFEPREDGFYESVS